MFEELRCPRDEEKLVIYYSGEGKPDFPLDCYIPCKAICPKCDRRYRLYQVFTFTGYEEMEEMK